jgi:hypothetical protein
MTLMDTDGYAEFQSIPGFDSSSPQGFRHHNGSLFLYNSGHVRSAA